MIALFKSLTYQFREDGAASLHPLLLNIATGLVTLKDTKLSGKVLLILVLVRGARALCRSEESI